MKKHIKTIRRFTRSKLAVAAKHPVRFGLASVVAIVVLGGGVALAMSLSRSSNTASPITSTSTPAAPSSSKPAPTQATASPTAAAPVAKEMPCASADDAIDARYNATQQTIIGNETSGMNQQISEGQYATLQGMQGLYNTSEFSLESDYSYYVGTYAKDAGCTPDVPTPTQLIVQFISPVQPPAPTPITPPNSTSTTTPAPSGSGITEQEAENNCHVLLDNNNATDSSAYSQCLQGYGY